MSWRSKYVGWYRTLTSEIKQLPELTDQEVMENVYPEDKLIIPTGQEHLPRNKQRPIPRFYIKLTDTTVETGLTYTEREQLELLKLVLQENYETDLQQLTDQLTQLPPEYETHLYSSSRESSKTTLRRKYVANRVDPQLLGRLIEEAESLRRGGRQIQNNQSVYTPPESPDIHLVQVTLPLNQKEFTEAARRIRQIYQTVTGIKTQREKITEKLSKPRIKRNLYREFIEALNEARGKALISAEERRKLNQRWRDNEDERETLLQELKEKLN